MRRVEVVRCVLSECAQLNRYSNGQERGNGSGNSTKGVGGTFARVQLGSLNSGLVKNS